MTEKEFLTELKALNLNWKKSLIHKTIRCDRGDCPIIAVARAKGFELKETNPNRYAEVYGKQLGLTAEAIDKIISTADDYMIKLPELLELVK